MLEFTITNRILPSLLAIEANRTRLEELKIPQHMLVREAEKQMRTCAENLAILTGFASREYQSEERSRSLAASMNNEQGKWIRKIQTGITEGQKQARRGKPLNREVLYDITDAIFEEYRDILYSLRRGFSKTDFQKKILMTVEEIEQYLETTDDHPVIRAAIVTHTIWNMKEEDPMVRLIALISGIYITCSMGYGFERLAYLPRFFMEDTQAFYEAADRDKLWVVYYIRMTERLSETVAGNIRETSRDVLTERLALISQPEYKMLTFLLEREVTSFRPIDLTKKMKVSNRTIATWAGNLTKQGFLAANTRGDRIVSYRVTDYSMLNSNTIRNAYETYALF